MLTRDLFAVANLVFVWSIRTSYAESNENT